MVRPNTLLHIVLDELEAMVGVRVEGVLSKCAKGREIGNFFVYLIYQQVTRHQIEHKRKDNILEGLWK